MNTTRDNAEFIFNTVKSIVQAKNALTSQLLDRLKVISALQTHIQAVRLMMNSNQKVNLYICPIVSKHNGFSIYFFFFVFLMLYQYEITHCLINHVKFHNIVILKQMEEIEQNVCHLELFVSLPNAFGEIDLQVLF